jgi:bifunctional aspartokinase / homoserine dehydrogenase 1
MRRTLQVMKFGGTSVGDASAIVQVAGIIRQAARESSVVVVVSAMSGVTNRLIEAANLAKAGNETAVVAIFEELRQRHDEAITALIHSAPEHRAIRRAIEKKLEDLFCEAERLCHGVSLLGELTPRTLDAISGLGECFCAPLVAAALSEAGVASEAIEATELVVTDAAHDRAEPLIDLTRSRCQSVVIPLLHKGIVPVITGFIGATEEGVLTTLGRGGSDYSATILGAALEADEVVIWSDVAGLLTADPKAVKEASTIPEISYREAAEMAYFGAKVLHPKTLRPVIDSDIPVWVKNTFAPDEPGTKISSNIISKVMPPAARASTMNAGVVKALASIRDASLITIAGSGIEDIADALARTLTAAAAVPADVLMISQCSSHNDICLVVPFTVARQTVEALRHEFSRDLMNQDLEQLVCDSTVSLITVVGRNLRMASGMVAHAFAAFGQDRESVNIIASVQGSSDCSMSFVVRQQDMELALTRLHREFELGSSSLNAGSAVAGPTHSVLLEYESKQATAD